MTSGTQPVMRFVRMVETAPAPRRADRAAGGTLPTRAFRYCEAATTAAALGWYVFPPMPFRLWWSGTETLWTYPGSPRWHSLDAAQFPGFRQHFDTAAPPVAKGYSPSFLGALPEPGIIQVWSGLVAQTRNDWSLVVRPPSNLPRVAGYDVLEGLVETDRWFGPLFTNIRLTRTDMVVNFNPRVPLFQVQPIQRAAYSDETVNDVVVSELADMHERDWQAYCRTVVTPAQVRCPHGAYATSVRKRRREELRSVQLTSDPRRNGSSPDGVDRAPSPGIRAG